MALVLLIDLVWHDGRVCLPVASTLTTSLEEDAAIASLLKLEQEYRKHLPATPPLPDPLALHWSLRAFWHCLRNLGDREAQPEKPTEVAPEATAAVHYSVDLLFRFLPDLYRLARAREASARVSVATSPLLIQIQQLAADWPLSGVGIPLEVLAQRVQAGDPLSKTQALHDHHLPAGASSELQQSSLTHQPEADRLSGILASPALRILYLDRIIERNDLSRAADPRIRADLQAALGACRHLAPELADLLWNSNVPEEANHV